MLREFFHRVSLVKSVIKYLVSSMKFHFIVVQIAEREREIYKEGKRWRGALNILGYMFNVLVSIFIKKKDKE